MSWYTMQRDFEEEENLRARFRSGYEKAVRECVKSLEENYPDAAQFLRQEYLEEERER